MEKNENSLRSWINLLAYGILILFASCKPGFEPIEYGQEACAHCKMTIIDPQFAAEIVTSKGKSYKFDDVTCMHKFVEYYTDIVKGAKLYVADYTSEKSEFIDANTAIYLVNDFFASPMNGNAAAFATKTEAQYLQDSLGITPVSWSNL